MSSFAGSLDTNALLRLTLGDVPLQRQAVLTLLASTNKQFAVADTAVFETAFILDRNYGFTRRDTARVIIALMSSQQINCNRSLFTKALEIYQERSALSLEDCALVCYAELTDAVPLYTFNKKLAHQVKNAKLITV